MNKLKLWGLALMTLVVSSAKADEGKLELKNAGDDH